MASFNIRSLLQSASTQPGERAYVFEDGDGDDRVVPIPISLDEREKTLKGLLSIKVEIEAERHRLDLELERVDEQIELHRAAFFERMKDLGIKC